MNKILFALEDLLSKGLVTVRVIIFSLKLIKQIHKILEMMIRSYDEILDNNNLEIFNSQDVLRLSLYLSCQIQCQQIQLRVKTVSSNLTSCDGLFIGLWLI